MKNLIIIYFLTVFAFFKYGNAQTEKGTFLLGGNVSYQLVDEQYFLNISPNIGYFVANKISIGLFSSLEKQNLLSDFLIGPNIRVYFLPSEIGSFFAGGTYLYNYIKAPAQRFEGSFNGFNTSLGYAMFLNNSIAIQLSANYEKLEDRSGNLYFGIGFQIHLKK